MRYDYTTNEQRCKTLCGRCLEGKTMKLNLNERNTSVNLALTGLMAALVLVATMFFKVEIPVGTDKTMIGFANVFCILSGL